MPCAAAMYLLGVTMAVLLVRTVCIATNTSSPTTGSGPSPSPSTGTSVTTTAEPSSWFSNCILTTVTTHTYDCRSGVSSTPSSPAPSPPAGAEDICTSTPLYVIVAAASVGGALVLVILLLLIVMCILMVRVKRSCGRGQSKDKLQDVAVQGDNMESDGLQNLTNPIYDQNTEEEGIRQFVMPIPTPNTTTDAKKGLAAHADYDTVCDAMEVSDSLRHHKSAAATPTQANIEVEDDPNYDYVSTKTCKNMLKAHEALSSTENVSGEYSELTAEDGQDGPQRNQSFPHTVVNTKTEHGGYSQPVKRIRKTEGLQRANQNRHSMPLLDDNDYSHLHYCYEGKKQEDNPRTTATHASGDSDAVYSCINKQKLVPRHYRKKPKVRPRPMSAMMQAERRGLYHLEKALPLPKMAPPPMPLMVGKKEGIYDDVSEVFIAKENCPIEEMLYDDPVELKRVLHSKDTDTVVQ